MTFVQMQYIVEIARIGSISAAARKLLTTQSNLSMLVTSVEHELNITIFERTAKGVRPTADGALFLEYAADILDTYGEMQTIGHTDAPKTFRVICTGLRAFDAAFLRLCRKNSQQREYEFALSMGDSPDCLRAVKSRQFDLAGIVFPNGELNRIQHQMDQSELSCEMLGRVAVNFIFREDHPLLAQWDRAKPFPFSLLQGYPMVDYIGRFMWERTLKDAYSILPKKTIQRILVSNVTMKDEVMRHTDAYSIGASRSAEFMRENGLVAVPIPNCFVHVCCCYRDRSNTAELLREYIRLVKEELAAQHILVD